MTSRHVCGEIAQLRRASIILARSWAVASSIASRRLCISCAVTSIAAVMRFTCLRKSFRRALNSSCTSWRDLLHSRLNSCKSTASASALCSRTFTLSVSAGWRLIPGQKTKAFGYVRAQMARTELAALQAKDRLALRQNAGRPFCLAAGTRRLLRTEKPPALIG